MLALSFWYSSVISILISEAFTYTNYATKVNLPTICPILTARISQATAIS